MDQLNADNVASITKKIAAYGSQLAAVFHSHALSAEKIPRGFEGAINILDATVATLNQVLSLLQTEAEGIEADKGKKLFSEEGLTYVKLLTTECATTLAKVEPIVADACLSAKELKVKRRREKRALAKNGPTTVDIAELTLDEKVFLNTVESTKWSLATGEIEELMERLYDLQLHLLLVFQVVTVGVMSRDVSSGKVDVKTIVAFHDRINRTAELVGIKPPKGRSRHRVYDSSSDSGSLFSSSDSDSDNSSILSLRRSDKAQVKETGTTGPPPPPPAPMRGGLCGPLPPPLAKCPSSTSSTSSPATTLAGTTMNSVNPPSYSEVKPADVSNALSSTTSTLLGTVSQTSDSATPVPLEKMDKSQPTIYSDEKAVPKEEASIKKKEELVPAPLAPRLFKSNTKGLRFKVKSLFRSQKSLEEEMKKALSDTDSHLIAVVIQGPSHKQVPHSAFHTLEATHMRTILSQLNGDEWYETFTKMDAVEQASLDRLVHPWVKGKIYERELVVLKVIHEKKFEWVALLRGITSKYPAPYSNNRVVLAILQEKLLDGKPLPLISSPPPPPPPPSGMLPPGAPLPLNVVPVLRPPPEFSLYPPGRSTNTSDLRIPQPPQAGCVPVNFPTVPEPPVSGCSLPPPLGARPGPPLSTAAITSVRISDTTPLTDHDATVALTTYTEYTLHLAESVNPGVPRNWSRVIITQESAERHLLSQRVQTFQRAGGNALEAKLRLTEQQSSQVTRLMDELKGMERDARFEWCWSEISLYNNFGEITDFASNGWTKVGSATTMHLIAKRSPKIHCKPMELYNSLVRSPYPTPQVNNTPSAPVIVNISRDPPGARPRSRKGKHYGDSDSDSDSSIGSSLWSDNSSVGNVRRRLRKNKIRKAVMATWDLGSDSDEDESEDEDAIKIKLELKRGDDVVQLLLNLWTPEIKVKGKGKEKVRKTAFGVVG